jgi:hypothetical protein
LKPRVQKNSFDLTDSVIYPDGMSLTKMNTSEIEAAPEVEEPAQISDDFYSPRQFAARVSNRLLIFLVVYVLSIGPMYWQWYDSKYFRDTSPFLARLYNPLDKFCELCPPFRDWLSWYIGLWN